MSASLSQVRVLLSASIMSFDATTYTQTASEAWSLFIRSRFESHPGQESLRGGGPGARLHMLELELDVLQKYTAIARQRRNAATSAGRLPAEVLTEIFQYAQEDWKPQRRRTKPSGSDPVPYDLGWLNITHTSSAWRKVALGAPRLWTTISCTRFSPRAATVLLRRSERLPLSLHVVEPYKHIDEARAFIINSWLSRPVLSRVDRLIIQSETSLINGWIASLCSPMPLLHVMIMKNRDPTGVVMLPEQILAGEHPSALRRLRLNGCLPNWTSPLFSKDLTHLELSLPRMTVGDAARLPELLTFRNIISSMSALEFLRLQDIYFRTPEGTNGATPYTLPSSFREFEMHVHNSSPDVFLTLYGKIWDTFHFPPTSKVTTEVNFHLTSNLPGATAVDPNGDLILRPFRELSPASYPVRGLKIANMTRLGLYYAVGSRESLKSPLNLSDSDLGDWAYEARGRRRLCASGDLVGFIRFLSLEHLQALSLSSEAVKFYDTANYWRDHFPQLQSVQRISIPYLSGLQLFYALANMETTHDAFKLFPDLQHIVLHTGGTPPKTMGDYHAALDMALLELLDVRRDKGSPLKGLFVDRTLEDLDVWGDVRGEMTVNFIN